MGSIRNGFYMCVVHSATPEEMKDAIKVLEKSISRNYKFNKNGKPYYQLGKNIDQVPEFIKVSKK